MFDNYDLKLNKEYYAFQRNQNVFSFITVQLQVSKHILFYLKTILLSKQ